MESPRRSAPLLVETLRGRVLRNGLCKPLTSDQLQLCLALAVYRQGVSRAALCNLLFPEMESEAAVGRLKVSVHGVRRQLGPESIVFFQDCYCFSAGSCATDLEHIETVIADAETGRGSVTEALVNLRAPRPHYYEAWPWFAAVEKRIDALTHKASQVASRAARQIAHPAASDQLAYFAR